MSESDSVGNSTNELDTEHNVDSNMRKTKKTFRFQFQKLWKSLEAKKSRNV